MKAIETYRDLDVWNRAVELVEDVYRVTKVFPDDERFGLTSQLRRSAVSIPSNIAEGYGRRSTGDYTRFLHVANGSLKELETQLIIAGRLDYLTREQAAPLWTKAQDIGKMLTKLTAALK